MEVNLDAWAEYSVWARKIIKDAKIGQEKLRVLKADANNEAYGDATAPGFCIRPVIPYIEDLCEVSCLEVDPATVQLARSNYPGFDIKQGDVTNLPYPDEEFHVVLDLSTIDHVADYPKVLDEYYRVLKPNGMALIVVWLDTYSHFQSGPQYWFEEKEFQRALNTRFYIMEIESFGMVHDVAYPGRLFKFVVTKEN